jgi:protein-S-isoprenylcysteine O-methyltransferase
MDDVDRWEVQVTLRTLLWIVVVLFPLSEIALAVFRRAKKGAARVEDRGSMAVLWLVITVGVGLAIAAQWVPAAHLHVPPELRRALALVLLLGGLGLRWASILTLGRLFTVDVAIHTDHPLVETGLYRYVRHPSYAGLLVAFLGLGVFYANWLSIVALLVPITLALVNRVVKEERVLLASLGAAYAAYCARTKRLIPGVL